MPRFLARLPYGAKTNPVEEFDFEEDTEGADHSQVRLVQLRLRHGRRTSPARSSSTAGARASAASRAAAWSRACPCHTFPTDDGGVDMKCPTEIAITDRREAELAKNGMMPLSHWKNTDYARVRRRAVAAEAGRVRRPGRDGQRQPRRAAAVPVRHLPLRALPEVHGARQDRLVQGTARHGDVAQRLDQPVRREPTRSPAKTPRRSSPWRRAEVVVEDEGNPGYYTSKFFLRPHYQLEGLTVSLRLVSKLPSAKK